MSKYVLMHGTFYEVRDDELMHWKYIKREKKNGKWVYYYDESAADRDEYSTYKERDNAERRRLSAERKELKAKQDLEKTGASVDSKIFYGNQVTARNRYKLASDQARRARLAENRADAKYAAKTVTSFASRTISKGLVKLANLFSGLFSKK